MKFKNIFYKYSIIIIFFLSFGIGFFLGKNIMVNEFVTAKEKDNQVLENKDFKIFWNVWNILEEKYNFEEPEDKDKVYSAIDGLTKSYNDPYTTFFGPIKSKTFSENVSGKFGGVGIEIGIRDNLLIIITPLKGSPGEKAGLKAGDIILEIDQDSVAGLNIDEAIIKIRGKIGEEVILKIYRYDDDREIEIKIIRDTIVIPTVEYEILDDSVFRINVFSFIGSVREEFKKVLNELKKSGSKKLIIDLRNNPGGYLESAVDLASHFIPEGKIIVKEDFGDKNEIINYRSKGYNSLDEDVKIIILVNSGSASASEIFAGAMREHRKATLVGGKTFGKGSVQEYINLGEGTSLKVTIAKWLTPEGNQIEENGLEPDFEVLFTDEDYENEIDVQLEKAIELLKEN